MAEQNLEGKTIKGAFWSAADAFLGYGVTFIVGIVLARLLSPAEYGLIGVCTIFTTILFGVVDSGFTTALIRKKNVTDDDYNTMFITNMVMSVVLFVGLYSCSPIISRFFERPELIAILRVMGLILIIQAFSITQITILTKRIDFKTKAKASLYSAVCSGMIGIAMAFTGFGVWALVGQQLSRQSLYTISLWMLNRWCPKMRFSRESFHYMWGFGWKMMLSNVLNNIWNQLYQVVVGKYYSASTLGQYSRAKEYASIFSSNFSSIIQRVTYPVLAEVQDEKERMVAAYRKVIKVTMFITALTMISMAGVAEPFIYCLIGVQWHEAATYLPLICISMSTYPLQAINLNMLQVQGRSDIFLYLEIAKKFISVIPLGLGVFVSIYWMLIGSIFTGIISFFLNSYYTGRDLHYSSWMQLRDIAPSYFLAFTIAFVVYFLKFIPFNYWIVLPLQILVGIIVYTIFHGLMAKDEHEQVKNIFNYILVKMGKTQEHGK